MMRNFSPLEIGDEGSTYLNITGLLKSFILNMGKNWGGEKCDCGPVYSK